MSSKTKSELNSRIVGSKLWLIWLWLSAGIVCLADIAVLVVLGIEGVQGTYYVLPIVFLALDVVVTALSAVTNHRFKRALAAPIVYAVLKLAIVVLAVTMLFGDTVIFSTLAVTLWLVFEFFSIVCIILSAVFAKGSGRGFLAIVAVLTVAIIAFGAVYMVFVSTSGFFGQNKERTFEKRTLVYSYYDDDRDSLVASNVLDGNGNTIVVPAEFNGMEVKGVDCTLFAQDGVDTVVLRCSEDVEFQNTEELCYMGDDVSIYADPDCIDTYREYFYSLSIDEIEKSAGVSTYSRRSTPKSLAEAYAAFANSMYPEVGDGEDGEDAADNIYVTVEIDYRYLPAFKNGNGEYEIPAVWIADRGSVFDPYEIYGYGYTEHMDEGSERDLCWCYYNFSNYILTDFTGPDGKSVVGKAISDSVTVSVKMTEIYAVDVGDGNDAKHTEPGLNRNFYGGYRYVTESTADEIMTEVAGRTGFTLSWEYSLSGSETRRAFTTLVGRLSDGMTIYPVWTMEAPKISAYADSYTVVYGNTVSFSSVGSFSDSDVALAYVWTHGTDTESVKQNFEKENMDPTKDGGTYTVTVTAGGDGITSLTTTASASVYITVNRRNLVLEWSTTSSSVYSGKDETVSVRALESASPATETSGVIYGDGVTFTLDRSETIKDAGIYDFEATLASFTDYYVISENAKWSFTIAKYTLYVVWSDKTLIYTGSEQHHSYSYNDADGNPITELGGDTFSVDLLGEKVSGAGTNAGKHTATLSITNANYVLAAETALDKYTIDQIKVTVTWTAQSVYTYTGVPQGPTVSTDDILESETGSVKLTCSEYGTDANVGGGYYTLKAEISSENYLLVESEGHPLEYTYTISQRSIELTWDTVTSFEYDGGTHTIGALLTGIVSGDEKYVTLTYEGGGMTDAGTYDIKASLSGDRAFNYTIKSDYETRTYTITKRTFDVEFKENVNKTYDAEPFAIADLYTTTGKNSHGLADTDDIYELFEISVSYVMTYPTSGSSTTKAPADAGTYAVTIVLTEKKDGKLKNYDYIIPESITGSITINKATLYLKWNEENLVYNGTSQHITAEITRGLVGNEDVTLCYSVQNSGDETGTYANAGKYTVTVSLGEDGSNYDIDSKFTVFKEYEIAPYDIKITWDEKTTILMYNGESQIPSYSYGVSAEYKDSIATILSATVSGYQIDVGTSTAEIAISNNNYTLSNASCDFKVEAKVITVTWVNEKTYTYNGSAQAPYATIDVDQLYTRDGTVSVVYTYNGSSDKPKDVEKYLIVAELDCANYVIYNGNERFKIVAKDLYLTWTEDNYDETGKYYAYTYEKDTAHEPTYNVGGLEGNDSGNVKVTYYMVSGSLMITVDAPTNAGNYVVVVTSQDPNYNLSEQKEIVINPRPVTVTVAWSEDTTFTYDGTQYVPTVTLSETDLEFNVSYVYTSEGITLDGAPKDVGTYTLTITVSISDGNYALTGDTEFTQSYEITARPLTVQGDATSQSFVYSGSSITPSYKVTNIITGENVSIIETYYASDNLSNPLGGAPVNVGSYVLVLTSGDHNYSMNVSIPFEIEKKEVSAEVSWPGDSPYTYDGTAKEHLATITIEDSPEYSAEYSYSYTGGDALESAPTNVGSYTVTVKLTMTDGNYAFTGYTEFSDNYVIQTKELSIEVLREQKSLTYNGNEQTPEYTVKGLEGDGVGSIKERYYSFSNGTYALLSGAPMDVGSYVLILTSSNTNYSLYAVVEFEIVPMPVTPVVTWNETSYTYDGAAKGHLPKITIGNLICDTDYTVEYSYSDYPDGTPLGGAPTDAGEYTVTVTITLLNTNYKLTASEFKDDYQITKRKITVEAAESQSFVYDGSAKSPTYTAGNIVEGESDAAQVKETYYASNDMSTPLTGAPSDAGSYVLLLTTENPNYSLDVSISFEITPAILTATVEWNTEDYTYDGGDNPPEAASITISGVSIDFTKTYVYKNENGVVCTPKNAGTYTVELTIELTNPNYALETATFTHEFTIKTAELTINWTYQESYSSLEETNRPTAQVEGAVSGETVTVAYTYYRVDEGENVLYGDGTKAPTEAGNYKVVITLKYSGSGENYTVTGSLEQSYTIVADNYNGEDDGN